MGANGATTGVFSSSSDCSGPGPQPNPGSPGDPGTSVAVSGAQGNPGQAQFLIVP